MTTIRRKLTQLDLEVGAKAAAKRSKRAKSKVTARKRRKGVKVVPPSGGHAGNKRRRGSGVILQQDQALEYFVKGYTYLDISKEMGCSTGYAAMLVKKGMERFQLTLGLEFKDWQNKHLTQLSQLYSKHIKHADKSVKSAEICVKIIDLEAEIVGSKKAPQIFVAPPPELEYDLGKLSVAELLQLRSLMANAKPVETLANPGGRVFDGEVTLVMPRLEHDSERKDDITDGEIVNGNSGEDTPTL